MEEYDEEFVQLDQFPDESTAHEFGLVILSQGAPYWVVSSADGYGLVVESSKAERLQGQLDRYRRESVNWPPETTELPEQGASMAAAAIWVFLMTLSYGISNHWPQLYEAGKVSAAQVMEGETYRVATALFLHADLGHLTGNLLFGAVFLHLIARHMGGFLAWLGVLLAGAGGNYLNAALYYPEPHYSIGASTAVFGAVGIIAALPIGFMLRHSRRVLLRAWAIPFMVGLVFLAWFGTGSERTDTSAHLMGFACGFPLGLAGGYFRQRLKGLMFGAGLNVDSR